MHADLAAFGRQLAENHIRYRTIRKCRLLCGATIEWAAKTVF
jgi:hypothetical protein